MYLTWSQGDIGSNPTPFDPHSPNNYVTKAQGSAIVPIGDEIVYLGNQVRQASHCAPLLWVQTLEDSQQMLTVSL